MAIAKKPSGNQAEVEKFIRGGGAPAVPAATPATDEKEKRTAVITRFPPALLDRIDKAAKRRGVSRAAWMTFTLSRALDEEEVP